MLDLEVGHSADTPRLRHLISPVDHDEVFRRFALEGPAAQLAVALLGGPARYHHSKLNPGNYVVGVQPRGSTRGKQ